MNNTNRHLLRQLAIFLWLGLFTLAVPAAEPGFAFGANGDDFSLSRYRLTEDGRLRHLGHQPINKVPAMVAVHPSGRFVAVVSSTVDTLSIFRLDPQSGALAPVQGSPFKTHAISPFSVQFHPSGRFVYLGARFSGVAAFAFDENTGAVTRVPGSPFTAQQRTRMAVVHPSGQFVYAVNAYSNSVSAFRVDEQTGALSEIAGSPYSVGEMGVIDYLSQRMLDVPPEAGGIPHFVDVDPQGRFVFVPNRAAASVSVFAVDPTTGSLRAVKGSPFFVGFNPYRSRVHPSGEFLLTTLWADGKLAVQSIDDSGRLTAVKGSPFSLDSQTPVDIAFNEDGSRVYVSNYDSNEISLLNMDRHSGKLRLQESLMTRLGPWSLALAPGERAKSSQHKVIFASAGKAGLLRVDSETFETLSATQTQSDALALSPDGRFVYSLDANNESITVLALDTQQGELKPVANGVVKTGSMPTDMSIDVNGWYLYVTNSGDASMSIYFLDPQTGVPKPVRGSPMRTGMYPITVMLDAAARYAFVVNASSNDVSVYRYLSNVTPLIFESAKYGSPFATGIEPVALVVDPAGHHVYVANAGSDYISAFHVHHKSGAMFEIPGSPFKTGERPVDLQLHPEGRWLYVANQEASTLSVFSIEKKLGALSKIVQTIALPVQPARLWFDESDQSLLVVSKDRKRMLRYVKENKTGKLVLRLDQGLSQPINDLVFLGSFRSQ